jgi:hypothetical protein
VNFDLGIVLSCIILLAFAFTHIRRLAKKNILKDKVIRFQRKIMEAQAKIIQGINSQDDKTNDS